jgi:hypothetical protein
MNESNSKFKIVAVGVTALLFISLLATGYFFTGNQSITKDLHSEKN